MLGDPGAHLDVEERFVVSALAVREALRMGGAEELVPLVERMIDLVVPRSSTARSAYRNGFFWVGLTPDRPGAAVYLETGPLGRDEGWKIAGRWLAEVLPSMDRAVPVLASLANSCVVASLGFEGTGPAAARAKVYFRLATPAALEDLGLDLLGSPQVLRFLALTIGQNSIDLDGLVMSLGFALQDGGLRDVKVDVCGHCLAYDADQWQAVVDGCTDEFGLRPIPNETTLAVGDCSVAFLGFGLDIEGEARLNLYLNARSGDSPPGHHELAAALDDAVSYLSTLQHEDGKWVDYELPVGASDQWVTAYVGAALARAGATLGHAGALAAARRGADWLVAERTYEAGWGYNAFTGPDADSTAMALSLLSSLGLSICETDRRFLAELWRPEGGIATFLGPGAWGQAHWDVTPWGYLALRSEDQTEHREEFLTGLRENLEGNGLWRSYWWRTPYYSTFLTLEALRELDLSEPKRAFAASRWTVDNAFDLACAVGIGTLRGKSPAALGQQLRRLLDWQQSDGRWPGHSNLRVTDDTCYEPWIQAVGEYYRDDAGTITTATVVRSLIHQLNVQAGNDRWEA